MPAENPPGFPFPANQDPDRTVSYRNPNPYAQQPNTQPEGDPTRMAYPGPGGQDDHATRVQYPGQAAPGQYADQTRVEFPAADQYQQQYGQQGYQQGYQQPYQQPYAQQQAYPQQNWQQPEELGYGLPPVVHAPEPKRGPGKGWIIAIIAALIAGVVGGGGIWAFSALSGGGTQPHEVLPAGAYAYVRFDMDPAANQKLALFQIARKFGATKDMFSGEDPRQALFQVLQESTPTMAKLDYAKDVEPWLGSRAGVAVYPGSTEGEAYAVALAVQVTDEAGARAFIDKTSGEERAKTGIAFRDGYAIIAENQQQADKFAKGTTLAQNGEFAGDLEALGEPGVLSFWADAAEVLKASGAASLDPGLSDQIKNGRFAAALRFDGDYAELAGLVRGVDTKVTGDLEPVRIGELPDSTVGAFAVSGIGELLSKQWNEILKASGSAGGQGVNMEQFVAQAQQQFGLTLPDDLATVLGKSVTVAVDEQGLEGDLPNVGTVLSTDPAKAQEVLAKIEQAFANSGTPVQLTKKPGDGKLVVATTEEYAAKLAGDGALKDSETFQQAIPNADSATFALYVNLDKIEKLYLSSLQGEERKNLEVLRAVGLSGQYSGAEASFTLRVLFN